MLAPLKKQHRTHRWYTSQCVCTSSTGHRSHPVQKQSMTQSGVAADLTELHWHYCVATWPDSHTRTHIPEGQMACGHHSFSSDSLGPGRLSGHFSNSVTFNEYDFPQRKQIIELRPNQFLSFPWPHPQHILTKTVSYEIHFQDISCPAVRRQRKSSGGTASQCAQVHLSGGCGWCLLWGTKYGSYPGIATTPSVGARHTAQTDTWLSYAPS